MIQILAFLALLSCFPALAEQHQEPKHQLKYSDLTPDEREIYEDGPISQGAYIGGGVAGTVVGLGIGHAIQGRFSDKGWIFLVGELATATMFTIASGHCVVDVLVGGDCSGASGVFLNIGAAGLLGFRIWEIVDVWSGGYQHNLTYERLHHRLADTPRTSLMIFPLLGKTNGLALSYRF